MNYTIPKITLIGVFAALSGLSVSADESSENIGVMDRSRPEYDAIGIRAGSFILRPRLELSVGFDDNIFAQENNEEEDVVYSWAPSVTLQSDFSRHSLQAEAYAVDRRYDENDEEDHTDWGLLAEGRLDIRAGTSLTGAVSYEILNEDRGSSDAPGPGTTPGTVAAEPTEFEKLEGSLVLSHQFNRVTAEVGVSYTALDFEDVADTAGGTIDQDNRDREHLRGHIEVGYDVSPDYNIFVRGTLMQDDYDLEVPAVAVDRDGDGYEVVAGAKFDLGGLITGEAFVGYLEHEYDDASLPEISGVAFGADLEWYVTNLTTVHGYASRSVEITTTPGASGRLQSGFGVGVDHELRRNFLVSGDVSFTKSDYEGITREDDEIFAEIGLEYLLNRNLSVRLDMSVQDRDSNISGLDYTRQRVMLRLILKK